MLYDKRGLHDLANYINTHPSDSLFRWFGQFWESKGNLKESFGYYEKAHDVQSLVRLLCIEG